MSGRFANLLHASCLPETKTNGPVAIRTKVRTPFTTSPRVRRPPPRCLWPQKFEVTRGRERKVRVSVPLEPIFGLLGRPRLPPPTTPHVHRGTSGGRGQAVLHCRSCRRTHKSLNNCGPTNTSNRTNCPCPVHSIHDNGNGKVWTPLDPRLVVSLPGSHRAGLVLLTTPNPGPSGTRTGGEVFRRPLDD